MFFSLLDGGKNLNSRKKYGNPTKISRSRSLFGPCLLHHFGSLLNFGATASSKGKLAPKVFQHFAECQVLRRLHVVGTQFHPHPRRPCSRLPIGNGTVIGSHPSMDASNHHRHVYLQEGPGQRSVLVVLWQ